MSRERESMGKDFEQVTVTYFKLAERLCLYADNKRHLVDKMNETLDIDILSVIDKLNPFAPIMKV